MVITLICGSQRHAHTSQSLKVTRYLESQLADDGVETQVINLGEKTFPLWDEKIWDGDEEWKALLAPTAEQLSNSDAFIFVVPEYHGMAPSALKNFLLLFSSMQFGHKPAMLVGVSSTDGGAYPLAEMRMNSAKNNRLCFIPEQIVVRNVESVLNEKSEDNNTDADQYFRGRFGFALSILKQYSLALTQVRESGVTFDERYRFGM